MNYNSRQKLFIFRQGLAWGIIISLIMIISGIFGASLTSIKPINQVITSLINQIKNNNWFLRQLAHKATLDRPVNIVYIGFLTPSDRESTFFLDNSPTILLLKFKPQQNFIEVINIPFDSQVKIPGIGIDQISIASRYGGAKLLTKVISENSIDLGISSQNSLSIDGYFQADDLDSKPLTTWLDTKKNLNQKVINQSTQQSLLSNQKKTNTLSDWHKQKIILKQLHQDWHSPKFATRIPKIIASLEQNIDTNLTSRQMLALANFIHQLNSEQISLVMLPRYIKYQPKRLNTSVTKAKNKNLAQIASTETNYIYKNIPVAVQNTTENPELVINLLNFLKKQNFHNVNLLEHRAIALEQTEIVVEQGDIVLGNYLKKSLGLGRLELSPNSNSNFELTIRIGEDAQYLNLEDGFIRY